MLISITGASLATIITVCIILAFLLQLLQVFQKVMRAIGSVLVWLGGVSLQTQKQATLNLRERGLGAMQNSNGRR
jgi:hypothetical protein